ncbi:MAG: aminotransferase class I/II-fold pyridoxal phosphate-dependent enzyme [Ktedonobacteraceae bacterium]
MEPFALERWMTTYEQHVRYDIAESGILPLSINELLAWEEPDAQESLLDQLLNLRLGYSEACGSLALRSAIAATYRQAGPENILVTTGAIEANFLLFNVLLDTGDEVIAQSPAYQQLISVPRAVTGHVSLWNVRSEGGFRFDLADLERLLTPRTRLIIVNTPHNPTGALLSQEELSRIYQLAESVGAQLLCDEAYRWLEIPGGVNPDYPAFNLGSRGISVGTVSKPFGLPGLRIGWIAAPEETIAACWALRDYLSLSPGKLNDALALLAFKHRERIVARNSAIITQNLATARGWFAERQDLLSWSPPRGGLLSLVRYNLPIASLDLANHLAKEYSVMLAPGSAFGFEHHLRLGIGQEPQIFAQGLERTAACLAALTEDSSV